MGWRDTRERRQRFSHANAGHSVSDRKRHNRHGERRAPPAEGRRSAAKLAMIPVLLAGIVFAQGINGVLVCDDYYSLAEYPHVHTLGSALVAAWTEPHCSLSNRPLVALTFGMNYWLGGLDVRGYHLVNVVLHLLATLLVFGIVRRALVGPTLAVRFDAPANWLAAAATLVWCVHPLTIETVEYLTQRTTLMMSVACLATIYAAARAWGPRPRPWSAAAVASCALGMGCQETMVVVPLLVPLYDRAYFAATWRAAWRARRPLYAALAACWFVLAAVVIPGPVNTTVGWRHTGISAAESLYTQAGVIMHYLRQCFWPYPLAIVYDFETVHELGPAVAPGLVVLVLLGVTFWSLARFPAAGFLGAWFFLLLAPTSSVLPIPTEWAADRRMYLPLLSIVVGVLVGAFVAGDAVVRARQLPRWWATGYVVGLAATSTIVLASASLARLAVYGSELQLWQQAVDCYPRNRMSQYNLGLAYQDAGNLPEAEAAFHRSLALDAHDADTRNALGGLLRNTKRRAEAIAELSGVLRDEPDHVRALANLALTLTDFDASGRPPTAADLERAEQCCRDALDRDPSFSGAHNAWGIVEVRRGNHGGAAEHFRRALQLCPDGRDRATPLRNLAFAYLHTGREDEAIPLFRESLSLVEHQGPVHIGLAKALFERGDYAAAIDHFHRAQALGERDPSINVYLELAEQAVAPKT